MNQVDQNDLIQFFGAYARKDRSMRIMLLAHFARQVDTADPTAKYQQLLDQLIKPFGGESNVSSGSDLRLALKVLNEFIDQLNDVIALNNFEEAFHILAGSLPKLYYLQNLYQYQPKKTIELIVQFHEAIVSLYREFAAPELKVRLDKLLIDLYQLSYYSTTDLTHDLYILVRDQQRTEAVKAIEIILDNKSSEQQAIENQPILLALKLLGKSDSANTYSEDRLIKSLDLLNLKGYFDITMHWLEQFTESNPTSKKLKYTLLNTYLKAEQKQSFSHLAIDLFLEKGEQRYYKMLKRNLDDNEWLYARQLILKKLDDSGLSHAQKAYFFADEKMNDHLIQLLKEHPDFYLISKVDQFLIHEYPQEIHNLYASVINQHLKNASGPHGKVFLREIKTHLQKIGGYKVITSLSKTFPSFTENSSFLDDLNA